MEHKAKDRERIELNKAIANFIKQGGTIKKLNVRDLQKEPGSDPKSDFIDTCGDYGESEKVFYDKVIARSSLDF